MNKTAKELWCVVPGPWADIFSAGSDPIFWGRGDAELEAARRNTNKHDNRENWRATTLADVMDAREREAASGAMVEG